MPTLSSISLPDWGETIELKLRSTPVTSLSIGNFILTTKDFQMQNIKIKGSSIGHIKVLNIKRIINCSKSVFRLISVYMISQ